MKNILFVGESCFYTTTEYKGADMFSETNYNESARRGRGGEMNAILNERYKRAADTLTENDIDIWISLGKETHFLGEPAMLFLAPMTIFRNTALILTSSGKRICVCNSIESEEINDSGLFTDIIGYKVVTDFEETLTKALAALMPVQKIALNFSQYDPSSDGLTYSQYLLLQRVFKSIDFKGTTVSSEPIMKKVRGKKSDAEVMKIKKAVDSAMDIFELARPHMKLGMSGKDVQALFQGIVREKGFGYSWQKEYNPYVSVGTRSSYNCKMPPADVYIKPGDLVNVDFGITFDGFASDNQRSFYAPDTGETAPPDEVQRAFLTMQSVNSAVCTAMKTGIDSRSLADFGNKVMKEYGYDGKKFGGYGHEICIYAHIGGIGAGESAVNNFMDTVLEENMTFTLEPAIITSHGRLCQEEVVCVKKDGGVMLSTPQKEIWAIYEI